MSVKDEQQQSFDLTVNEETQVENEEAQENETP